MELVFILGLVGLSLWLWAQAQRIDALSSRLEELEERLARFEAEQLPPLLLDHPLPPDDSEPLVLDTPLPEAFDDADADLAEPALWRTAARAVLNAQTFAIAAVAAALLAPLAAGVAEWPSAALALYVCAAGAAGFALAALQRWTWLALATFAGMHLWFAAAIASDDVPRALALVGCASLGGAALALRAPKLEEPEAPFAWSHVRAIAPGAALSIGGVLLIWAWLAIAAAPTERITGPALVAALHVALAAYAVRMRAAAPAAFAATAAALVAGFIVYQRARFHIAPLGEAFYPTILAAALVVVASAVLARPHRSGRSVIAAAGAIGAAVLVSLAAFSRPEWGSLAAWGALFAGAVVLFAAAWRASADANDRAVDFWAGAAAALLLLGVESAFPAETRTVGHAAASLAFTAGLTRRGWRVLKPAALLAAALTLAYALGLIGSLIAGEQTLWRALLMFAGATALLFAARAIAAGGAREAVQALARDLSLAGVFAANAARTAARVIAAMLARLRPAQPRPPSDLQGVTPAARRERRRGRR